jgi:ribosomal protein S18 acetylase RimI-like enzyme
MVTFRNILFEDRVSVKQVLEKTQHFTDHEIRIALELVDMGLSEKDHGYQFVVAEKNGGFAGYGCWGQVPLTLGTYDIYWIAVSPDLQGQGVGSQILSFMETQIMKNQGRLILIETSSSDIYQDTRAFYEKRGYVLESRIRDFYKPNDDRCVYVKRLGPYG